ncbi:MAG TPA: dihydropyrimidinase [Candidatus Binataceae bacterium]|nr:dihydropyrimidinase [Candidatus Binataceae bacterium]
MVDLAITGASVVTPSGSRAADIGIAAGQIKSLAAPGALGPAARTLDATGMIVMPGVIDAHTHLDAEMFGSKSADDFESGTIAAACGGVTTIIDYAFQAPGGSLHDALEKWRDRAERRATIDYGFHVAILDPTRATLEEIPRVVEQGVTSFKIFMMRGFEERARDFLRAFRAVADSGGILTIHAEDEHLIGHCTDRLVQAGCTSVAHYGASRPPVSESAAVARGLKMAEVTQAPAYFVHLSSAAAIDEIRRARDRGSFVLAETRPIYLYLTEERFLEPQGEKYVGQPPLRGHSDVEALWKALADGTIDVVATDHCSWSLERKLAAQRFTRILPGVANLETFVPMLYSEGVANGRITIERMVDLVATNPARIFGIYPRKGAIIEGADADLTVFDPHARTTIHASAMHSRADYDPFEGFEVTGWPAFTISRGEVIVESREPRARAGRGKFLVRDRFRRETIRI